MAGLAGAVLLEELLEVLEELEVPATGVLAGADSELVLAVAATELEVERESVR